MDTTAHALPLFDWAASTASRQIAIAQVATGPIDQVLDAIEATCLKETEFSTDDVLQQHPDLEEIAERRILGAAMTIAKSRGWCVPTDRYAASNRTLSHGRQKRLWRSLITTN